MQEILHKPETEQSGLRPAAELLALAGEVFPGGVLGTSTVPPELAFVPVSGSGCRVQAADGREFIDYTMGSGVLLLGYRPAAVLDALREQASRLCHSYGYLNQPAIELAAEIVQAVPSADELRFTASGAEATAYAMRLARAATGRSKILKFEGGYHGFHDYAIHSFSSGYLADYPRPRPNSAGIPAEATASVLVAPFNDLELTTAIAREHQDDLAGIIVEPIQRIVEPAPGFLSGLRQLADETGACLIFDEIVTGFRIGYGGAQQRYGITPDLTTLGKIIGGGLPLAAVCGRREIMELCAPGRRDGYVYQSGTMNGNPLAAACGLATLRLLREDPPYERLAAVGATLRESLGSLLAATGERAQVIGTDSLWQVVFTDQEVSSVRQIWEADSARLLRFHDGLLRNGVLVWRGNRSFVSTAHDDEAIGKTMDAAGKALADLARS